MAFVIYKGNDFLILLESNQTSESIGTEANGSLKYGKRMPSKGKNFETYSYLMSFLGRACVHSNVRDTMLGAYKILEITLPEQVFIYGEIGWCKGGRFRPHRTHQNGLSVDFMVPLKLNGHPITFPSAISKLYGYILRFDEAAEHKTQSYFGLGKNITYKIDFEAIIEHLKALEESGLKYGVRIKKIIFDPPLLSLLRKEDGYFLISHLPFMEKQAWFPHDSHYHIDFELLRLGD